MKHILKYLLCLTLSTPACGWGMTFDDGAAGNTMETGSNTEPTTLKDPPALGSQLNDLNIKKAPPLRDRWHLIQQDITFGRQTLPLYELGDVPFKPTYDHIEYALEGPNFVLKGMSKETEVIRQTFRNLHVHSFVSDAEILLLLTTEGELHAIDKEFLLSRAFKEIIPVWKNLLQSDSFRSEAHMDFWTRGLPPSLFAGLNANEQAHFPRNSQGELIFTAGDLVLHRGLSNDSKAFDLLSRSVITRKIEEQMDVLDLEMSVTSPEVFEKANATALASLAQKLQTTKDVTDGGLIEAIATKAMLSLSSHSVQSLRKGATKFQDAHRLYDKATMADWINSYNQMIGVPEIQKSLKDQSGQPNLSRAWQNLIPSTTVDAQYHFRKPHFLKRHAMALAYLTGVTTAAAPFLYLNSDTAQLLALMDHIYDTATPPILKIAEFRFPLLASMTCMLAAIPLLQFASWTSPHVMIVVANSMSNTSTAFKEKLFEMHAIWKKLEIWQRLVTFGARVYSVLVVAFWNHLGTLLKQPQIFQTLKEGRNPFQSFSSDSEVAKALGLERDFRLGVINPFQPREHYQAATFDQQRALQHLKTKDLLSKKRAFLFVSLTLYNEKKLDPATLAQLLQESDSQISSHQLQALEDLTPQKQKEWATLAELIAAEWARLASSPEKTYTTPEDQSEIHALMERAQRIVDRYQASPERQKLRARFNYVAERNLAETAKTSLLLGVEDARILRTVYANKTVAELVRNGFIFDHILSAGVPALWGERANPLKPVVPHGNPDGSDRNLLTFRPSDGNLKNLWTNPEHLMGVWLNVCTHFFQAGARRILLFQGNQEIRETNYEPAEKFTHRQTHETESLPKALYQWGKNVLDTRQSALGEFYVRTINRQIRTMQAGALLSISFRMLTAHDPNLETAFLGWYFMLVSATWGYAYPWAISDQANTIEEQRLAKDHFKLYRLQVQLSQSLRLKENAAATAQAFELLSLYQSNEARLKDLIVQIGHPPDQFKEEVQFESWSHRLLEYSWGTPPFPTAKNKLPSVFSSAACAYLTTLLAIPLTVLSLDHRYLTFDNLLLDTAINASGFVAAYYLIGKEGLWSKILNRISAYREKSLIAGNEAKSPVTSTTKRNLTCKEFIHERLSIKRWH